MLWCTEVEVVLRTKHIPGCQNFSHRLPVEIGQRNFNGMQFKSDCGIVLPSTVGFTDGGPFCGEVKQELPLFVSLARTPVPGLGSP